MPRLWSCWTMATRSKRRPDPLLRTAALAALVLVAACTPPAGQGLPRERLDDLIGRSIGDPATCVLLADRATGRIVYRYGDRVTCDAALPACDRPGTLTAADTLRLIEGGPRMVSCPSSNPGRGVGWAAGPAPGARGLNYAAVMDSSRALPGREIRVRLEGALRDAGI